jgi:MFS family permease
MDVSTDALAIDVTVRTERGKLNGIMTCGLFSGIALGSFLLGMIADVFGYPYVFFFSGASIILTMFLITIIRERKTITRSKKINKIIIDEFKNKFNIGISTFLPIVAINSGILIFTLPLYMKNILFLEIRDIGLFASIFVLGKVIGSLTLGAISDNLGRRKTLYIIILNSILFSFLLIFADNTQKFILIYFICGILNGGLIANLLALCMDISNPKIGATQFSIFMSLLNLGEICGGTFSGSIITNLGFTKTFLISSWVFLPALLIFYITKNKINNNLDIHK